MLTHEELLSRSSSTLEAKNGRFMLTSSCRNRYAGAGSVRDSFETTDGNREELNGKMGAIFCIEVEFLLCQWRRCC